MGHTAHVVVWALAVVPGTVLLLAAVLFLSAWTEAHVLSPPALIVRTVRARRSSPDHAETVVTREFERLLRQYQR